MKVAFEPYENQENKYIVIMQNCIQKMGHTIVPLKESKVKDCKIIILNWYENSPYPRGSYKNLLMLIKRCIRILYFHMLKKKVVFVMHNKQSHEQRVVSKWLQKFLVNHSDVIQIHSRPSLKYLPEKNVKKAFYIPHPNYIGEYPMIQKNYSREELKIGAEKLVYLFVGAVKPYKNIEMIIEAAKKFDKNVHFIIAGKPSDDSYKEQLLQQIGNCDNITTIFKFIPDEDLVALINTCDTLVLPYDISSSLNSGTVFLAFSNKKTVIAPLIASLEDIGENKNLFIGYTYKTQEEHKKILEQKLKDTWHLFEKDKKYLDKMGQRAYDYVKVNNSTDVIIEKYREMFRKLV